MSTPALINVQADYGLSVYQEDNLYTLARFLSSDITPPPTFNIKGFMWIPDGVEEDGYLFDKYFYKPSDVTQKDYHACGTCACAVGMGPLAGIPAIGEESWTVYSYRVFVPSYPARLWDFLFSAIWSVNEIENTKEGTARRIFYFLKYGLPDTWSHADNLYGEGFQPWRGIDLVTESL